VRGTYKPFAFSSPIFPAIRAELNHIMELQQVSPTGSQLMEAESKFLCCPEEVISLIIKFVDPKELLPLRLASKKLHASTMKPFGLAYFTERQHKVSEDGMDKLLEITEHPNLGPYVKTIIFDNTYTIQPVLSDHFVEQLKRMFKNVQRFHKGVVLGVRNQEHFDRGIPSSRLRPVRLLDVCTDDVIKRAVAVLQCIGCPLHGLKLDSSDDLVGKSLLRTRAVLGMFLKPMPSPFYLDVAISNSRLMFNQTNGYLKVSDTNFDGHTISLVQSQKILDISFAYFSAISICQLDLIKCHIKPLHDFEHFLTYHAVTLQSIKVKQVFGSGIFGLSGMSTLPACRWSNVIRQCSKLVQLKQCSLSGLFFNIGAPYPTRPALKFHNGTDTIEMESEDLSDKLRDLAAWIEVEEVEAPRASYYPFGII
jgi:hypothetical protein